MLMDGSLGAWLAALAIGYGLGSIPFGLLLTRMAGLGDVRKIGSGNIGATNVLRTGNKGLAAATLLLDALKGTAAVWIGSRFGETAALAGGAGAFVGHCFPVWLRFAGGKGIATYVGVALGAAWQAALVFGLVWFATAAVTRYSSLSALFATIAVPLYFLWAGEIIAAIVFAALSALAWLRHRTNIARLLAGTESRIGSKG